MKLRITVPVARQLNTHAIFRAASGNVMSTVIPNCEVRGEMIFYKYTDEVCVPSFRIETENLSTLDVYPTVIKFYLPFEKGYETITIKCDRYELPVIYTSKDNREVFHAVVSDVGHLWLLHAEYSQAELIKFLSIASSEEGDAFIPQQLRTCLGHVRTAHLIPRHDRVLELSKF